MDMMLRRSKVRMLPDWLHMVSSSAIDPKDVLLQEGMDECISGQFTGGGRRKN